MATKNGKVLSPKLKPKKYRLEAFHGRLEIWGPTGKAWETKDVSEQGYNKANERLDEFNA